MFEIIKKYFARIVIGPIIGITRGVLGLITPINILSGMVFSATYLLTFGFNPLLTILCYSALLPIAIILYNSIIQNGLNLYSVLNDVRQACKNIIEPIVNLLRTIQPYFTLDYILQHPTVLLVIGFIALNFGLPILGLILQASFVITNLFGTSSLLSAFMTGFILAAAPSILNDLVQIFNHIFIKEETSQEYTNATFDNGPIISGIAAGLLSADAYGAEYGVGYNNATIKSLVTVAWDNPQVQVSRTATGQWTVPMPRTLD